LGHRGGDRKRLNKLLRAHRVRGSVVEFRRKADTLLRRELDARIVFGRLFIRDFDNPNVVVNVDLLRRQGLNT